MRPQMTLKTMTFCQSSAGFQAPKNSSGPVMIPFQVAAKSSQIFLMSMALLPGQKLCGLSDLT